MKNSKLFVIILSLSTINLWSQIGNVGINTSAPQSTLDIRGKNDTGYSGVAIPGIAAPDDGLLVPRVNSIANNGTVEGQLVFLTTNQGTFSKGFHFWNGTSWNPISGGSADGDAWGVNGEDLSSKIYRTGEVGIGTSTIDNYAITEISSSNKGIIIPKINLTSDTLDLNSDGDNNVSNQPTGLLIFNSGNTFPIGFYFWNGQEWRYLNDLTTASASIATLECSKATLSPPTYTSSIPYSGILKIPYTGGNGGIYKEGASISVNGLTIKLLNTRIDYGNGELSFSVIGTPTVTSPTTTNYLIEGATGNNLVPFLISSLHCSTAVGNSFDGRLDAKATIGPLLLNNEGGYNNYMLTATSADGKFSIRVRVPQGSALGLADVEIRSNDGSKTLMWNYHTEYNGGEINGAGNAFVLTAGNTWYGNGGGTGGTASTGPTSAWGDPDVYFNAPEHRRYTWYTTDSNDKTVYEAVIMLGAPNDALIANATNCPAGICTSTKAYIRIEQITSK